MRSRLFNFLSCLLFSTCAVHAAQAADLAQQRQLYDDAKRALAKGDSGPYFQNRSALLSYPLEPYLAYDELTARLKTASNAEIEQFLAEHGDLPQANWMKLRWLRWLAERGDWAPFVKYYDPKLNFTELDCLNGQYQLSHNLLAEGYATAEKLWLTGKTQPSACDALFDSWAAQGQLTEQKRWQRVKLAAEARNYGLATALVKGLTTLGPQGRMMIEVAQKPDLLSQPERFVPADEAMSDVVGLGLRRLARQDPDKAMALLDGYAASMRFSRDEKVSIAREIGLTLARRYDGRALDIMTQYDPELRDNTVTEWPGSLGRRLSVDPPPAPGPGHDQPLALLAGPQPGAGPTAEPAGAGAAPQECRPRTRLLRIPRRRSRADPLPAHQPAAGTQPAVDQQGSQHARPGQAGLRPEVVFPGNPHHQPGTVLGRSGHPLPHGPPRHAGARGPGTWPAFELGICNYPPGKCLHGRRCWILTRTSNWAPPT